ncbi:hypothetical protein BKA61DRAFT_491121, partial [Leptodontidium sp. MPI-SDFR-AT-0119]
VDAISINQDDPEERSKEVARMGGIYRRARRVIVWLGGESEDSNLAMSTLEKVGRDVFYRKSGSSFA